MRFCGLGIADTVPDANTLWDFREALIRADALDALFKELDRAINQAGFIPRAGQVIDASLIAAPRQRNSDGEKAAIKAGKTARDIWPDKPAKAAQKDTSARWTVKYSKAKARPMAASRWTSPSQPSAARATFPSIARTASSAGRSSRMRPSMMVPGFAKG